MNELWHENPSFDCLTRGHLWMQSENVGAACGCSGNHKACWCPWCGTGTYDSECLVLSADD